MTLRPRPRSGVAFPTCGERKTPPSARARRGAACGLGARRSLRQCHESLELPGSIALDPRHRGYGDMRLREPDPREVLDDSASHGFEIRRPLRANDDVCPAPGLPDLELDDVADAEKHFVKTMKWAN